MSFGFCFCFCFLFLLLLLLFVFLRGRSEVGGKVKGRGGDEKMEHGLIDNVCVLRDRLNFFIPVSRKGGRVRR